MNMTFFLPEFDTYNWRAQGCVIIVGFYDKH